MGYVKKKRTSELGKKKIKLQNSFALQDEFADDLSTSTFFLTIFV